MARPTPTQTRELDRAARSLRHEITQIRELLDHRETDAAARRLAEIDLVSLRLVAAADAVLDIVAPVPACQCEHIDHEDPRPVGSHGYLDAPAGSRRAHHVGAVCDECVRHRAPGRLPPAGGVGMSAISRLVFTVLSEGPPPYYRVAYGPKGVAVTRLTEGETRGTRMAWFSLAGEAISYLRSRGGDELANRFRAELMSRRYAPLADERDTSGGVQ